MCARLQSVIRGADVCSQYRDCSRFQLCPLALLSTRKPSANCPSVLLSMAGKKAMKTCMKKTAFPAPKNGKRRAALRRPSARPAPANYVRHGEPSK
eukprot:9832654-Alexandrium_andersonii.AAC.1